MPAKPLPATAPASANSNVCPINQPMSRVKLAVEVLSKPSTKAPSEAVEFQPKDRTLVASVASSTKLVEQPTSEMIDNQPE
jgi:hypothetical protein